MRVPGRQGYTVRSCIKKKKKIKHNTLKYAARVFPTESDAVGAPICRARRRGLCPMEHLQGVAEKEGFSGNEIHSAAL